MGTREWIVCQIGAREHYAVARALESRGRLRLLVTDAWAPGGMARFAAPARIRQRRHRGIPRRRVRAFTWRLGAFELKEKLRGRSGWDQIVDRNAWFMRRAAKVLEGQNLPKDTVVFSYSYAALEIFRVAKRRGWKTVLGQIDPGPYEQKVVSDLHKKHPEIDSSWKPAPLRYWGRWREETRLADVVIANSAWSARALGKAGVDAEKIRIVPLVYTPPSAANAFKRRYPDVYTRERPLRILFLGQVNLRKGLVEILQAAARLEEAPVHFTVVGSGDMARPERRNITWHDAVPRAKAARFYREADVFLFPTHSDGFGLTQLEAQAWKLPVIASRRCGEVVVHGTNGFVLEKVSAKQICKAIEHCLENPAELRLWSENSGIGADHDEASLAEALLAMECPG